MSHAIIEAAMSEGRSLLSEVEAKAILADAGVPVTTTKLATDADEAVRLAGDIGGVELGLADADAVRAAFDRIAAAAQAADPGGRMNGVSVQPMAAVGTEVIMGMTQDAQFGPVLMFGLGGVLVEVLKDVAFRVVPLEQRDARQMLREIQGFPVLEGYRGGAPADLDALESILLQLSQFAEANPEVSELDLNPIFAYDDGAIAVDARIVLT